MLSDLFSSGEEAGKGEVRWDTIGNHPVNKGFLSTGESRELVCVNVGLDSNPRVDLAPTRNLSSNEREHGASKNSRNVADTGGKTSDAVVNKMRAFGLG